jgi:hypothetical protein
MLPNATSAPSEKELKENIEKAQKTLTLYAGLPAPDDKIDEYLAAGGKLIYFLTAEEKAGFRPLKDGEAGVTWESDASVKRFMFENMHLWVGGQIGGHDPERAMKLADILKDLVDLHNFDLSSQTFLTKDREPMRNAFRNYRYVEDGVKLRRARNLIKGGSCVIVAAGPSLDTQWGELARIRRTCPDVTFIVAGRSYKAAMKAGVPPDFVVEVEQFDWDDAIWMFAPEPPDHTILCAPVTACPGVLSAWPRLVMILLDHEMASLMGMKIREDSIDGGNSILHHMFNLAVWMGADEINLAGVDLSYPKDPKLTHAAGTFPAWPREILTQENNRQEPLLVKSTDGGDVIASPGYKNFATFLAIQIERAMKENAALKVYNFSPHGQKIEGAIFREIETWRLPSPPPESSLPSPSLPEASSGQASTSTESSSTTTTNASAA